MKNEGRNKAPEKIAGIVARASAPGGEAIF
jgi:hypothetical protein